MPGTNENMREISSLNLSQVVALLRATPQTLRKHLRPLDQNILCWRPRPNERSINETIVHLIDMDHYAFAAPIHQMLASDLPELEIWEAEVLDHNPPDDQGDVLKLLTEFEELRRDNARVIAGLRPSQLARSGFHPEVGEVRVVDFVYDWVYHDSVHIKEILEIIQLCVWPKMGNLRHFGPPK